MWPAQQFEFDMPVIHGLYKIWLKMPQIYFIFHFLESIRCFGHFWEEIFSIRLKQMALIILGFGILRFDYSQTQKP
jgi:hypothetical protein